MLFLNAILTVSTVLAGLMLCITPASGESRDTCRAEVVSVPQTAGGNSFYTANKPPLTPSPLIKLPVGAVRPEGWLRHQLELMADGFTGHLQEISQWCRFEGSAWTHPQGKGQFGWEELPYWLRGYVSLGYVLGDDRIISDAEKWVEGILSTSRPDGYFGPEENLKNYDLWPNMVALYVLRTHYEATGDTRVLEVMTNYFRWMDTVPFDRLLPGSWQKIRGGDNLDSILWLYNRTGDARLLETARVNHERTADWTGRVASWHGVNICQCFREPAQFYQQTGDTRYLEATERNYDTVWGLYGQVPGGMFGADENCREGYVGPRQAAETCSMVEFMHSAEILVGITGDVLWADRCEEVAFNSLPAAMTPDLKGLHYLTAPNMVQLDRKSKAPLLQNGGDMLSYNAYQYRCCQHNVAFGWPYFAEHLWMATEANGAAAVFYAPCEVNLKVGNGTMVKIVERTGYPFRDNIQFEILTATPIRFPLYLRVPGWCASPHLQVNGVEVKPVSDENPAGQWLRLDREWQTGDKIELRLPMTLGVKRWEKNGNCVSVHRGPLAYSLKIGERWEQIWEKNGWYAHEVYPSTPWNYGLVLDADDPTASFIVEESKGPVPIQPFTTESAPVIVRARGKKIPNWQMEPNGLIGRMEASPVKSSEPEEEITLIPMGCARLRLSAFPQIGEGPDAREWSGSYAVAQASHTSDTLLALDDGILPRNSSDRSIPRFTWWDHRGTNEWVQYRFSKARQVSRCEVYWYDDEAHGAHCRVPQSWRVLYWDGARWADVQGASACGVEKDRFNVVTFDPVKTEMIRLDVQLRPGFSGGILEWKVS